MSTWKMHVDAWANLCFFVSGGPARLNFFALPCQSPGDNCTCLLFPFCPLTLRDSGDWEVDLERELEEERERERDLERELELESEE